VRPRVIPVLQLHHGWLTKTQRFGGSPYLGDPVNAVRIFNELEVDELILCDISASRGETPLDPKLIRSIASEAFMPVAYGGAVGSVSDAREIVRSGVEKIVLNSAISRSPELVTQIASEIGTQSVVASVDVRSTVSGPRAHVSNGRIDTGLTPVEFAQAATGLGAGEIVLNSIDRDGTRSGYDLPLLREVSASVEVPVLALGGADSLDDIKSAIENGADAVCAASLFVYFGRHQAVLITYPSSAELDALRSR